MSVVTIRGRLGSGAPEIGRLVADSLQADYVDREIIAKVAEKLHWPNQEVAAKEMPTDSLEGRIAEALGCSGLTLERAPYLPTWEIPSGDTLYVSGLKFVITELAKKQPIVIQGRGSRYILEEYPGCLHVLIVAPQELRVRRAMVKLQLDQEAAEKEISRIDNSRREFIRMYFGADQEDPLRYDLVINTENLGFEAAASIVVHAVPLAA